MQPPSFIESSPLLEGAFRMARDAHHGPRRRARTGIDHPVAVAELLHRHGFGEEVVAAALLHDVVEDTATKIDEVRGRFGPEVAELVAGMTEDPGIEPYPKRKAEHRSRVRRDHSLAAIYAADKLANTRALKEDPTAASSERIEHYVQTLRTLRAAHPRLPFLDQLEGELDALLRAR